MDPTRTSYVVDRTADNRTSIPSDFHQTHRRQCQTRNGNNPHVAMTAVEIMHSFECDGYRCALAMTANQGAGNACLRTRWAIRITAGSRTRSSMDGRLKLPVHFQEYEMPSNCVERDGGTWIVVSISDDHEVEYGLTVVKSSEWGRLGTSSGAPAATSRTCSPLRFRPHSCGRFERAAMW